MSKPIRPSIIMRPLRKQTKIHEESRPKEIEAENMKWARMSERKAKDAKIRSDHVRMPPEVKKKTQLEYRANLDSWRAEHEKQRAAQMKAERKFEKEVVSAQLHIEKQYEDRETKRKDIWAKTHLENCETVSRQKSEKANTANSTENSTSKQFWDWDGPIYC